MASSASSGELPPVIFLMGATATGKTGLAVELVQRLPVEIVSVDSSLVYRGMDIGTAKPEASVLEVAPHRLIDICDVAEAYSAGSFRRDALAAIREIHNNGNVPLLVGGTGLYFRVLQGGIAALPEADTATRTALDEEAARRGWQAMHEELGRVDPRAAQRIHPNDRQRIQRALEVFRLTGRSLSDWHDEAARQPAPFRFLKYAIATGPRQNLGETIEMRFRQMIAKGFLDEVKGFYSRGDVHSDLPSMRAVGYRQLWQHLDGAVAFATACERAVTATRQLAKRQMTWLRGEEGVQWIERDDVDRVVQDARFAG